MNPPECGASAILTAGGPTRVPFHLCCALAMIGTAGPEPGEFVCGALEADPATALLTPGDDVESPVVPARS
jgi:hypothetical protein